jgi:signal transduction histidine kinase
MFEHPRAHTSRQWVFDVLLALLVLALSLPNLVRDDRNPFWTGTVLVLAQTLSIVARRVWPITVFAWNCLVATAALILDPHYVPALGIGLVVTLYSVAAGYPRRTALVAAGLLEAGAFVALVRVQGQELWFGAILLTGMVAAALGLGLYSATRRAYLAELHDRAARLERERDQQRAVATAAERARIAREMHDIVAHHLSVIVALSDGAAAAVATAPERAVEVMHSVSATGRQALNDTRRLLGVLGQGAGTDPAEHRRPMPDLAGIDELVQRVRAAGIPITYQVHGAPAALTGAAQLTVYRLIQEALTNILKHAGTGASAVVRLDYRRGELRLDVEDDGAGQSAAVSAAPGRGLAGMRERVQAFGGEVHAGPASPSGWRVSARLCVDEAVAP